MRPGFLVTVRGAPRVGPEVEKRAKIEAQAVLTKLLTAARAGGDGMPQSLELSAVDVANSGVFVLLLTGPGGCAIDAAIELVQVAYSSLAAAVSAGTAADEGLGFQYCDKILPVQHQLSGAPTASGISEAVQLQLGLTPPAPGSSVAVLIHARGDDVHGAADRGGLHLTTTEAREAVLKVTVNAGCGVNLQVRALAVLHLPADPVCSGATSGLALLWSQSPDWAVVVTMWRAVDSEAAVAGVAVVPGISIRTKPRLAPVRLPRPKIDPATMASKSKALKRRVQSDSGDNNKIAHCKSERKVAAPVKLNAEDATTLLRAALVRRTELIALVRPVTPHPKANDADSSSGSPGINGRTCDCWRLVHGTGDGFDGLTSDVLGLDGSGRLRVLVEAHHKWADPAPLVVAIRSLAEDGLLPHGTKTDPSHSTQAMQKPCTQPTDRPPPPRVAVYLKLRFLADSRQSGGLLADGSTELPLPAPKQHSRKKMSKKARLEHDQSNKCERAADGATLSDVDALRSTPTPPKIEDAAAQVEQEQEECPIVCSEHGLKFELSITRGEHIGLFLDSRTARAKVQELAAGRRVLNLFAFTGGTHCTCASAASSCHGAALICAQTPRHLLGRRWFYILLQVDSALSGIVCRNGCGGGSWGSQVDD